MLEPNGSNADETAYSRFWTPMKLLASSVPEKDRNTIVYLTGLLTAFSIMQAMNVESSYTERVSGALVYLASAFAIFLLRQTFKSIPQELVEAARVEGAGPLQVLWRVYVPLARPTYVAFGLVSVSYHWNNFLWPLIVTNSVESRPLTVGLAVFGAPETGVDWSVITAATVMTMAPLLIAFLLFQRQFVQSFMRAGIR